MRILHIMPSYKPAYEYGGTIESTAQLCECQVEAGQVVDVFTTLANGVRELDLPAGQPIVVQGVTVTYFRRVTKDPTHVSPALWFHLWKTARSYDVIHIHSWWNPLVIFSAWICILQGLKIIISPRGMLTHFIFTATNAGKKKWIHNLLGKQALKRSVLHATAESEYEECTKLIHGWGGFVLPNIVFLPDIKIEVTKNDSFTLLFMSRIHPKKGLELLIEAISTLPFPVRLRIAGTGEEEYVNKLKDRIARLNLSTMVDWLGWRAREEKFHELMRSDSFILTSYNENFANVVIESLHVGTPVIVSEGVALASFVEATGLGWVTSLTSAAIRESIIAAYTDRARREVIRARSRAVIEKYFDVPTLISRYLEEYNYHIRPQNQKGVLEVQSQIDSYENNTRIHINGASPDIQ